MRSVWASKICAILVCVVRVELCGGECPRQGNATCSSDDSTSFLQITSQLTERSVRDVPDDTPAKTNANTPAKNPAKISGETPPAETPAKIVDAPSSRPSTVPSAASSNPTARSISEQSGGGGYHPPKRLSEQLHNQGRDPTCWAYALATYIRAWESELKRPLTDHGTLVDTFVVKDRQLFHTPTTGRGGWFQEFFQKTCEVPVKVFNSASEFEEYVGVTPQPALFSTDLPNGFGGKMEALAESPDTVLTKAQVDTWEHASSNAMHGRHAMVIGKVEKSNGKIILWVKNSWGVKFGESGWFKMEPNAFASFGRNQFRVAMITQMNMGIVREKLGYPRDGSKKPLPAKGAGYTLSSAPCGSKLAPLTAEACEQLATRSGFQYVGRLLLKGRPEGCYTHDAVYVFFNNTPIPKKQKRRPGVHLCLETAPEEKKRGCLGCFKKILNR